jgi:hypothetical protein
MTSSVISFIEPEKGSSFGFKTRHRCHRGEFENLRAGQSTIVEAEVGDLATLENTWQQKLRVFQFDGSSRFFP